MRRLLTLLATMVALLVVGIPGAQAAVIEIPINTVVYADEGSVTLLATEATPAEHVGTECAVVARAKNQSSVHPGNDLIVASGSDSVLLADVERAPGVVTEAGGTLLLGETVTVSLRMGADEVFSGGIVVAIGECTPPTMPEPAIEIVKTATPEEYGVDGIGHFTIEVTNPGPLDLVDVHVTDDVALEMDPSSDCPNPNVPDLAVGESYTYECTVGNLDGVSPFTNVATAIGTGPYGKKVTATDNATVFPPVMSTTLTTPPTTEPPTTQPPTTEPPTTNPPTTVPPTLPNTGASFEQVRGFSFAGFGLFFAGVALLSLAAFIGRERMLEAVGYYELAIRLRPAKAQRDLYVDLHSLNDDGD